MQVWIIQFYLQITPYMLPLPRKRSLDCATTDCCSRHLIAAYYSFIDPKMMKGWVGLVGWPIANGFVYISGHPSAVGRVQDTEDSPVKDRRSTIVPRLLQIQLSVLLALTCRSSYGQHRTDLKLVTVDVQPTCCMTSGLGSILCFCRRPRQMTEHNRQQLDSRTIPWWTIDVAQDVGVLSLSTTEHCSIYMFMTL